MLRWAIDEVELGDSFLLKGILGKSGRKIYNRGSHFYSRPEGGQNLMGELGIKGGWDLKDTMENITTKNLWEPITINRFRVTYSGSLHRTETILLGMISAPIASKSKRALRLMSLWKVISKFWKELCLRPNIGLMNVQKSKLDIEKYGRRMTMFIISEWHKLCGERKLGNKTKEKYQEANRGTWKVAYKVKCEVEKKKFLTL